MKTQTLAALENEMEKILQHEMEKAAEVTSKLQPHQQRVVDRIQKEDQPGLVVAHGLGSGKTLTSIAAQDALGMDSDTVVPAALQENYRKEIKKHTKGKVPKANVQSMQNVATKKTPLKRDLMVVDEAHRMRDPGSSTFQTLKGTEAKKRLLLTGSPFYNHPSDIAPLIDLAANKKILPFDREEFTRRYISEKTVNPSIGQRILNVARSDENKVKPGTKPILYEKMAPELKAAFHKWVDYHPGSADAEGFPTVERKNVPIEMSKEQLKVYDTLMNKAPAWVAAKVRRGLPPSKQESQQLNAFLTAPRQAVNSTSPFLKDQAGVQDPKIQRAFESLQKTLKDDPKARAVVYSNFLQAGIDPYKAKLDAAKIPYGEFTGQMTKAKRDEMVRQYNTGNLRALLLSSAGGEGLDLKGTRLMQIMEPHWNREKIKQVEGRGARYKSHADLPPEARKLLIENYIATRPQSKLTGLYNKVTGRKPDKSVDEYLTQMSDDKEALIDQFRALLPNQPKPKEKKSAVTPTTEVSRQLASSFKPELAAHAAFTLPGLGMGARIGSLMGPESGLLGALGGAALGNAIGKIVLTKMVQDGKNEAKKALKSATLENKLREDSGHVSLREAANNAAGRLGFEVVPYGYASDIAAKMGGPVFTSGRQALTHGGLALGSSIVGGLGSAYLNKYRRMIAVNELDNVRESEADKDAKRLARLRKTVANLETKVEGDGWNAPVKSPESAKKEKNLRHDW